MNTLRSHPKVLGVGDKAFRLYVCSLLYANEHLTDGRIPHHVLDAIAPGLTRVRRAKDELLTAKLWESGDGFWTIHDYLRYQTSADSIRRNRVATADRVRRHRQRNAVTNADVTRARNGPVQLKEKEEEVEGTTPPLPPQGGAVELVFEAWREATGKSRAQLDAKRRRLIRLRLRSFPLDDLVDAVRGWRHSPHHRGENSSQTVYNDLGLLLRDTAHVEMFRDLERGSQQRGVSNREFVEAMNAQA